MEDVVCVILLPQNVTPVSLIFWGYQGAPAPSVPGSEFLYLQTVAAAPPGLSVRFPLISLNSPVLFAVRDVLFTQLLSPVKSRHQPSSVVTV